MSEHPANLAGLDPADAQLDHLRVRPATVAEALERCVRIDTITEWLGDLRSSVRDGYLAPQADAVEQATGGAFNVPVKGLGQVYRTDPQPKPYVADAEALARWWVADVMGDDPDRDAEQQVVRFGDEVVRRTVATADSDALLAFLDAHANAGHGDDEAGTAKAASELADRVRVDVEWVLPASLLDDVLAAKVAARDSGQARAKLVATDDGHLVVDTATGEELPGVGVRAPGKAQLTVKPDKDAKAQVRAELEELLGRPALHE